MLFRNTIVLEHWLHTITLFECILQTSPHVFITFHRYSIVYFFFYLHPIHVPGFVRFIVMSTNAVVPWYLQQRILFSRKTIYPIVNMKFEHDKVFINEIKCQCFQKYFSFLLFGTLFCSNYEYENKVNSNTNGIYWINFVFSSLFDDHQILFRDSIIKINV